MRGADLFNLMTLLVITVITLYSRFLVEQRRLRLRFEPRSFFFF